MDSRKVQLGSPHLFRDGPVPASCFLLPLLPRRYLLCSGVQDGGVRQQILVHVHALLCSHGLVSCGTPLQPDAAGLCGASQSSCTPADVQGSSGPVFGLIGGDSKHLSFVFTLCRISARLSPSRCFHQGSRQGRTSSASTGVMCSSSVSSLSPVPHHDGGEPGLLGRCPHCVWGGD